MESGRTIGNAKECAGLYLLKGPSNSNEQALHANSVSLPVLSNLSSKENAIMLWHFRLGHPNFQYLKKLFPTLFNNINPKLLQCEVCQFSKHVRSNYPIQGYKSSHPFTMIHSDIWGPSRVQNVSGYRWFVSFIDAHTRLTWVYLMKEKSEASMRFRDFHTLIQNQFQTKIKIFKSDNAKEYYNSILGEYFRTHGIINQSSCVNTP